VLREPSRLSAYLRGLQRMARISPLNDLRWRGGRLISPGICGWDDIIRMAGLEEEGRRVTPDVTQWLDWAHRSKPAPVACLRNRGKRPAAVAPLRKVFDQPTVASREHEGGDAVFDSRE
jgi:hypothetical protein